MTYTTTMPRALALGTLMMLTVVGFGINAQNAEAATKKVETTTLSAAAIIAATNEARIENGLLPVATNTALMTSAKEKANDMVAKGYFGHSTPEGARFWTFIDATGYKYAHAGENLGTGFKTAEGLVNAWLKSPTHRANLLSAEYDEIGIGLAYGVHNGKATWFVVQHFGSTTY